MTSRIIQRAGDTFLEACQAFIDLDMTQPRDLTHVRVSARMVAPLNETVDLDVNVFSPTTGEFTIGLDEAFTRDWMPTTWYCWIIYEEAGDTSSTETFQIEVIDTHTAGF